MILNIGDTIYGVATCFNQFKMQQEYRVVETTINYICPVYLDKDLKSRSCNDEMSKLQFIESDNGCFYKVSDLGTLFFIDKKDAEDKIKQLEARNERPVW